MFNDIASKISGFFNKEDQGINLEENEAYSFRDLVGREPFYTCLPYESYDNESHIYHNKNSLGFVLIASPMIGASEDTIDILHSLIVDTLPEGAMADIILWPSPKISPALDAFYQFRSLRGGIYEKLAAARRQYLLEGAYTSLIKDGAFLLRDFKIIIAVSIPKKHEEGVDGLVTLRDNVISTMKSISMAAETIEINEFLSFMRDLANPNFNPEPATAEWNPDEVLSRQITDPEMDFMVKKSYLDFNEGECQIRCLSPVRYPKKWQQWAMTDLIGDLFKDAQRIPCPFMLKLSVHILGRDKSEKRAVFKGARADQLAASKVARFMPRAKKISENWKYVSNRQEEGDCLVGLMFQVILSAPKKQADQAENRIKKLFLSKGWTLKKPKMIQFPCWLASFPMVLGDGLIEDMRYFNLLQTKLGYNAVNMAPLQGEWKGVRKPLLFLIGRRGQMMWWDPFENDEGNYNVAVAGKSGSGKSVFLQELETGVVGSDGRTFVIDVGRSSEKTCRLLGGSFIAFTQNTKISINPFTHIKDIKESLPMLRPMFSLMAAPSRRTNDLENAIIEQAIMKTWEKYGNEAEVTAITDLLLNEKDQRAKDLGTMLYPYTKNGSFGRFFNGACTLDFDSPFINLELEDLKSKKDLQEVVLYMLMYQITEVMYRGDRQTRIMCVIDEAWDIFRGEQGGEFIETGYRRARKYQGSFVSGTQGVNDYYRNKATIAALENSDWMCLLSQKEESIKQLKKSDRLSVDGHLERLLNSVKTIQKEYSEVFIKGPNSQAIGRLILEPFSRILYSSKGDEFAAIEEMTKQGLSVGEAVERLSGQSIY